MFKTILVANRGEIACRIIATAKRLGIKTVAVYSSIDSSSLHVTTADEAYCIGKPASKDSYLNIAAIIAAAKQSQAQAIHPGYGFLSENADFARACAAHKIVFIGPSIEAMQAMASKQLAKQLLSQTKVPLIPGYQGDDQNDTVLLTQAQQIGFPVLLKAASGGGGKGMRTVTRAEEFPSALEACRREALASFSDSTMIIEKLITNPRHVELQIIADHFGNVFHLFDRDCSIQRRHQKIIEEAPAPNLSESLRSSMRQAAITVAKTIQYTNAGTVEFLVDSSEQFYFMEMNTRLQVEHPVTEMITGIDLVEWQIQVAANHPLPITQQAIQSHGHAVECRIYAEDPEHQFIPSIGQIDFLRTPAEQNIRIDTGVIQGSTISQYYDPMIAKLIVWGQTRDLAIQRMQWALDRYAISGIKTNLLFLKAICAHSVFNQAQMTTQFLEEHSLVFPEISVELALIIAVSYDYLSLNQASSDPIHASAFAWHALNPQSWKWKYAYHDQISQVDIHPVDRSSYFILIDQQSGLVHAQLIDQEVLIEWQNKQYRVAVASNKSILTILLPGGNISLTRYRQQSTHHQATNNQLSAPMPATIVAILVNVGDQVKKNQPLLVLEAMKMEHTLSAPEEGVISELFFSSGDQVNEGVELLKLIANA